MEEQVAAALARAFDEHRIIFWDDAAGEWAGRLDALVPDGVTIARLANDEIGWKHRMIRAERKARFLVYRRARPADAENWLLDVELGAGAFSPDPAAIWATELGLSGALAPVLRAHEELLRARPRVERLRARLTGREDANGLRMAMLEAACDAGGGAGGGLAGVLEALLDEAEDGEGWRLIQRAGLAPFLWEAVARAHGYVSDRPGVADYAVALFDASWRRSIGAGPDGGGTLTDEAVLFFRRWANNRLHAAALERRSADAEEALEIEAAVARLPLERLDGAVEFAAVDRQVIRLLAAGAAARTLLPAEAGAVLERRRKSHWWDRYRALYEAIGHAVAFGEALAAVRLDMQGMAEGVRRYAEGWYRIDGLYRRFTRAAQTAGEAGLTGPLSEAVERAYVDTFVLKLGDRWQEEVDRADCWEAGDVLLQRNFYDQVVNDYRRRGQRIVVIVSDALRYEVADELGEAVRRIDRFDATLEPMLGALPSYTQLGMAALLPHQALAIRPGDDALVFADGRGTAGLEARAQVLAAGAREGDRTAALKAEAFLELPRDAARALVRDHDVLFLYHDRIDAVGDKLLTEARTFEACDAAVEELAKLVKRLANANATHMVITADHGFLYQQRSVEKGDFLSEAPAGAEIFDRNRRFVLGHGLSGTHGLRHFTARQLGLAGDLEALFPKSINRLRRQGSGSRFVHGGASLQEVVVPLLRIAKGRQSDVATVEVELVGLPRTVTTSQFSVTLFQQAAVGDKIHPRQLRLGVWSQDGTLLSDMHDLTFDRADVDPRARETAVRFILSTAANAHEGEDLELRLEERHGDTTRWRTYHEARFRLRRGMASDFDF